MSTNPEVMPVEKKLNAEGKGVVSLDFAPEMSGASVTVVSSGEDLQRRTLFSEILSFCEPQNKEGNKPQAILFGLHEIQYLPLSIARRFLSQDDTGKDLRLNPE